MANFNFQIREAGKTWADVPVRSADFDNKRQAVEFGKKLNTLFQAEIRLTQGKPGEAARLSGTYIESLKG